MIGKYKSMGTIPIDFGTKRCIKKKQLKKYEFNLPLKVGKISSVFFCLNLLKGDSNDRDNRARYKKQF
ncbi:MAG TPA: hypothetical protein EYQ71_00890 [Candidatus Thioglobus sp.]|jgi:hypothetical protein|nr:hypothetical protein [Candidatus Thioglobus sp.]